MKMKIYLDTCSYCRHFDDQFQDRIKKEAEAFANLLEIVEMGKIILLSSDVLVDDLEEIVDPRKSIEVFYNL